MFEYVLELKAESVTARVYQTFLPSTCLPLSKVEAMAMGLPLAIKREIAPPPLQRMLTLQHVKTPSLSELSFVYSRLFRIWTISRRGIGRQLSSNAYQNLSLANFNPHRTVIRTTYYMHQIMHVYMCTCIYFIYNQTYVEVLFQPHTYVHDKLFSFDTNARYCVYHLIWSLKIS